MATAQLLRKLDRGHCSSPQLTLDRHHTFDTAINCARCHGLEAISGGIAPDLRLLEDGEFGDEWFMERVLKGYSQNGAYKMPPFEELMSQEAMWAIRSYIEVQPK